VFVLTKIGLDFVGCRAWFSFFVLMCIDCKYYKMRFVT
jgi:hypothetical protein